MYLGNGKKIPEYLYLPELDVYLLQFLHSNKKMP